MKITIHGAFKCEFCGVDYGLFKVIMCGQKRVMCDGRIKEKLALSEKEEES